MAVGGLVSFRLLGPVCALDAGVLLRLGGPRRRSLLAALLLHRGVSLSVERLVELLWTNPAPPSAATMVHGAVSALRRTLECEGRPRILVSRHGGYLLDVAADRVDAARFERGVDDARREAPVRPQRAAQLLMDALAEWRGPALAGVEEPFARLAAGRLEELRLEGQTLRIDAELRMGNHGGIVAELEELTAQHPLREELCAHLMLALYRCGRQADALAAYRRLRTRLVSELGVEPGREVRELESAVLRHESRLRAVPVGVVALPAPLGSLVGRDCDLKEVGALLTEHRLVTLTGPGGAGKTRLGIEVARRLTGLAPCVVDLAPLAGPELMEQTLAEAVGVRAEPGQPLARTIAAALAARPTLLVLDNCEHLVSMSADLVQALLAAAAPLRVLATSRERLGVPGERVHAVRPLDVPPVDASEELATASAAVRLFLDRAASARPGFTMTSATPRLVAELCRRLDGLPLAIELAAARSATLPLHDLVERVHDQFALLESATRAADARHRSLTTTLEWGHTLLEAGEQTLFAQLAVFPGSFDLAAVLTICGRSAELEISLSRLVASSLVQLDDQPNGGTRYRMLQTVRAFAADRLDGDVRADLAARHTRHYVSLAQQARRHLFAPQSGPWLERLHAERDNLRAALEWSFRHDTELGVILVDCLWHYWDVRGARDEGLHWVRAALDVVGTDQAERLPLLSAGALLFLGRAELADTERLAREQLECSRGPDAAAWDGDALALLATVDWARGRYDRALARYEDGVSRSLAGGDVWGAALAEAQLARLHRDRGEPDAARAVALRAFGHADSIGEATARGLARDVLASVEQRWGDAEEAARLADEALALYREVGYAEGEASCLRLVGTIALGAGRDDEARAAFQAALDFCRRIGHRAGIAEALEGLAAATADGDPGVAGALTAEAASLRAQIGIPRLVDD